MGYGWGGDGVGFGFDVDGGGLGVGYGRIVFWGNMHSKCVGVMPACSSGLRE